MNDRPYVASRLLSLALNTDFSSALVGKAREHAPRLDERLRWEALLPVVACDAGAEVISRIFAPLGYTVDVTRLPLDPAFPEWGEAELYTARLDGAQRVRGVLSHLYVLLPVLDNTKHYFVEAGEIEKLLDHGDTWLVTHPERELIVRRYLRYKRSLVTSALTRIREDEPAAEADADESAGERDAGQGGEREQELREAGTAALDAAMRAAQASAQRGIAVEPPLERLKGRTENVERYAQSYRRYCWDVQGLDGVRVAPFHLLASEGRTYFDRDHL